MRSPRSVRPATGETRIADERIDVLAHDHEWGHDKLSLEREARHEKRSLWATLWSAEGHREERAMGTIVQITTTVREDGSIE
ncbi:MAG TPA: hypothetical protein VH393_16105, partial [Ktedonobacterales bacterium]